MFDWNAISENDTEPEIKIHGPKTICKQPKPSMNKAIQVKDGRDYSGNIDELSRLEALKTKSNSKLKEHPVMKDSQSNNDLNSVYSKKMILDESKKPSSRLDLSMTEPSKRLN